MNQLHSNIMGDKKKILALAIGFATVTAIVLTLVFNGEERRDRDFSIGVVYFLEHPAIEQGLSGIRERFHELFDEEYQKANLAEDNAFGELPNVNKILERYKAENVDIVLALTTPCAMTAKSVISDIPIVFVGVTNPVGLGLVDSLDYGKDNIVGTTSSVDWVGILKLAAIAFPEMKRVGILYNPSEANSVSIIDAIKSELSTVDPNLQLSLQTASSTSEVFKAAQALADRVDALFLINDNTVVSAADIVIKVAKDRKIPIFASDTDSVAKGALFTIGVNYRDEGIAAIDLAHTILTQKKTPSELPVFVNSQGYLKVNERIFSDFPSADRKIFEGAEFIK